MSKKALWIQVGVFLGFIALFFVWNLVKPQKGFSEVENRTLQTRPEFSLSAFFSGSFTKQYEDYVTDQFALRDGWTALKARAELISGKPENNGVYLCEGDTLIEGYTAPAADKLDFNLDAVNKLAENTDADVYFTLIPSAAELWRSLLPDGAPNDSQKDVIGYAYDYVNCKTVDVYSVLSQHADESIFYRTDHHWTTLGAYYGYCSLAQAMGLDPVPLENYTARTVTDSFYGTTWSSSGFSWVGPDSITTYVEQGDAVITNYPAGSAEEGTLYDESYLAVKDKYSYFYGGNTPLLEIETGNDGPALLILRDSYMDSLSPFLFAHFSRISIVDLRYYKLSLSAYIAEKGFDDVLVCYSVPNFSTDDSVFLAGR